MIKCDVCGQMVNSTTCMTDWFEPHKTKFVCDPCKMKIADHIRNDYTLQMAIAKLVIAEHESKKEDKNDG